jgi:hypothetical protein
MTHSHGAPDEIRLTGSFHKRKDEATAFRNKRSRPMQRAGQMLLAALLALSLAACATQPAPDLTPPPGKRLDAKTTLESGRR